MIAWLLLVCTPIEGGYTCLAPIEFSSKEQCVAVGNSYRQLGTREGYNFSARAKCISIRKRAQ